MNPLKELKEKLASARRLHRAAKDEAEWWQIVADDWSDEIRQLENEIKKMKNGTISKS